MTRSGAAACQSQALPIIRNAALWATTAILLCLPQRAYPQEVPPVEDPPAGRATLDTLEALLGQIHTFLWAVSGSLVVVFVIFALLRMSRTLLGIR